MSSSNNDHRTQKDILEMDPSDWSVGSPSQQAYFRYYARLAQHGCSTPRLARHTMESGVRKLAFLDQRRRLRESRAAEANSEAEGKNPKTPSTSATSSSGSPTSPIMESPPLSSSPAMAQSSSPSAAQPSSPAEAQSPSPPMAESSPSPLSLASPSSEQEPQQQATQNQPKLLALHGPRQPGEPRRCPTIVQQRLRQAARVRERSPTPAPPAMKREDRAEMMRERDPFMSREDREAWGSYVFIDQEPASEEDS